MGSVYKGVAEWTINATAVFRHLISCMSINTTFIVTLHTRIVSTTFCLTHSFETHSIFISDYHPIHAATNGIPQ